MDWGDVLLIALVSWALWTFIPRHIRRALRSGVSPAVVALSEAVLDMVSIAGKVLTHLAYKLLIGNVPMSSSVRDEEEIEPEPEPPRSDEFSLPAATEPRANGSANLAELQLNAAEVAAIHRMIEHNKVSAKPSKSSTIQAGFGVSRGGSGAYTRASLIYDALFGVPVPAVKYRQRTPEQDALRQQLGISKR
jgi:hypothetical protein